MCQDCNGLGSKPEMDPDLIVPDHTRSIREGAVEVWATGMAKGEGWTADLVDQLSAGFGIDLDTPWGKLPKKARDVILFGSEGGQGWCAVTLRRIERPAKGVDTKQRSLVTRNPEYQAQAVGS